MKKIIAFAFFMFIGWFTSGAQTNTFPLSGSAGIGTTTPHLAAALEVVSTTKGLLIPRMNRTQRDGIVSPTKGLLVYQTGGNEGFYVFNGTSWVSIANGRANTNLSNLTSTAINADLLPATDNFVSLGSTTKRWKDLHLNNLRFADGSTQTTAATNYTAGTGVDITGGVVSNTAPDQTLALTAGSGIAVSGTYPNFTIDATETDPAFTASAAATISNGAINNWNAAYSWGNHAGLYPSLSGAYANPAWISSLAWSKITAAPAFLTTEVDPKIGANNTNYLSKWNGSALVQSSIYDDGTNITTAGLINGVTVGKGYPLLGIENTVLGDQALASQVNNTPYPYYGSWNTAVGYAALNLNSIGSFNTAVGRNSLKLNSSGTGNNALGVNTLYSNTSGEFNTAVGNSVLYNNTTGNNNTAMGASALSLNTTGLRNTASGISALANNTTASNNSAFGSYSLFSNTTGQLNTANGYGSLYSNISGSANTAVGYNALSINTTGGFNTAIGYGATTTYGVLENATAIGNLASVTFSNSVKIGDASVLSIGGQVPWTSYSDKRLKKDIQSNVPGLAFINLLKPVTYHFNLASENKLLGRDDTTNWKGKYDIEKIQFTGFLAQDVQAAAEKIGYNFSGVDNKGPIMGLRYAEFVVPLTKAVQELSVKNDELRMMNEALQNRLAKLEAMVMSNVKSTNEMNEQSVSFSNASLEQNIPNPPVGNFTKINYNIPNGATKAELVIVDNAGRKLKQISLSTFGKGVLNVDTKGLASGTYTYTMYVDGKMVDTKKMVVAR